MNLFSTLKNKIKFWLSIMFLISLFAFWWISHAANDLLWQIWEPSYDPGTVVKAWMNVNYVWRRIIHWGTEVGLKLVKSYDIDEETWRYPCKSNCKISITVPGFDDEWNPINIIQQIDCWDPIQGVAYPECKSKVRKAKWKMDVAATKRPSLIVWVTRALLTLVITLSVTMILYNWMKYIIETWQWKESKNLIKNVAYIVIWILISLFSVIIIALLQSTWKTIETEITTDTDNFIDKSALLMEAEKD